MKLFGFIEIGESDYCANCGRATTQWVTLANGTAPTCGRCQREVEQAIRDTQGYDDNGRNFGPHE